MSVNMVAEGGASSATMPDASVSEDRVLPGGWYTLWGMLIVTLFAFVDRQLLTLAAAPIAQTLKLSDTQLGMLQGLAPAIFSLVAVYPIAWLADRYDRRFVLGGCLLAWSVGTAACGLAQNYTQLFLATIAIAAGEAALTPIMFSVVPDLFKGRKRAFANSLQYFFAYVGISLALALGGAALGWLGRVHGSLPDALQALEPWRIAFFIVVLPTPLLLILIMAMRLRRPDTSDAELAGAPEVQSLLPQLRAHRWAYSFTLGGLGAYLLAFGGFMAWLPVIGARLFQATPEMNGYAMALASGCGTIIGVAAGTLLIRSAMARLKARAAIRVCWLIMLFSSPLVLTFLFVNSFNALYACFALLMGSGTAIGVLVPTMLQDMAPAPIRARFLAIYSIVAALLSGAAPSIVGVVSDVIGGERSLLVGTVIVALPSWFVATLLLRLAERHFEELTSACANA